MYSKYASKVSMTLKEKGAFGLSAQIVNKIWTVVLKTNTSICIVRNLKDRIENLEGFDEYEIVFDDLEAIIKWMKDKNALYPWMYAPKEEAAAHEYGHIIPFIKYENNIIGYTKIALNKVYIRDYDSTFSLSPNKVVVYDITLLPEFRGKRLAQHLRNKVFYALIDRGIDYVYGFVEPWNIASRRSSKAVGYREICRNRFISILGLKFHSCNPRKFLCES